MATGGQLPIVRDRLPHTLIRPIRPFPPRFMPPNVFRLGPPSNYSKSFYWFIISLFGVNNGTVKKTFCFQGLDQCFNRTKLLETELSNNYIFY
ncbi:hypothetical protein M0802_015973 [Mischocyttarus mexicanus]|nr:hypothetical protein M0802_015973 [Mischocyttarus mexicanus]